MRDLRRFYRWKAGVSCHWEWEFGADRGDLVNFSFGGARVRAQGPIPVEGADILIDLERPGRQSRLLAHVIYTQQTGHDGNYFGIEFYGDDEMKSEQLIPVFRSEVNREAPFVPVA